MGLGPAKSSLLRKLGQKQAWEMPQAELEELVAKDQFRRSTARAVGRIHSEKLGAPRKRSNVKKREERLEDFGLAPSVCQKLRASGKQEFALILEMRVAGLI